MMHEENVCVTRVTRCYRVTVAISAVSYFPNRQYR